MERVTYTARWIFPVAGPPLDRGTITIAGDLIEAVEPHVVRTPDVDLGNVAIIPGLVNAHTHLDLSGARCKIPPTDPEHFCDWLLRVIEYRKSRTLEQVRADIREGLAESLRFGTTLLGDIAVDGMSWDMVADENNRSVVFREIIGLTNKRHMEEGATAKQWLLSRTFTSNIRVGLSPHAPYSTHSTLMSVVRWALNAVTVHLAESPAESELLLDHTGPFVEFLEEIGAWNPDGLSRSLNWVIWRLWSTVPVLLIHCNYLSSDATIYPNQCIVYCPRTHAAFGHPLHPFREFLARGVNVALGTDSLASNPDLDLLAEARCVKARHTEVGGDLLLRMATINGAKALGWADECGSLVPGKSADFVVVPLPDADAADPHDLLLGEGALDGSRHTLFRGTWRA